MNYNVYVMYDKVSEECNTPFFQKTDASAKRAFTDTVNRSIRPLKNLKVEDFELFRIGSYESSTGTLSVCSEKEYICNGADVDVYEYDEPAAPQIDMKQLQEQFQKQMSMISAASPTKPAKKRWFKRG